MKRPTANHLGFRPLYSIGGHVTLLVGVSAAVHIVSFLSRAQVQFCDTRLKLYDGRR
jgi:hypothetical protein